jgi:hypothetical protein
VRKVRRNDAAVFGGIQVILCGDFSQLPPIPGGFSIQSKVCFVVLLFAVVLCCCFKKKKGYVKKKLG